MEIVIQLRPTGSQCLGLALWGHTSPAGLRMQPIQRRPECFRNPVTVGACNQVRYPCVHRQSSHGRVREVNLFGVQVAAMTWADVCTLWRNHVTAIAASLADAADHTSATAHRLARLLYEAGGPPINHPAFPILASDHLCTLPLHPLAPVPAALPDLTSAQAATRPCSACSTCCRSATEPAACMGSHLHRDMTSPLLSLGLHVQKRNDGGRIRRVPAGSVGGQKLQPTAPSMRSLLLSLCLWWWLSRAGSSVEYGPVTPSLAPFMAQRTPGHNEVYPLVRQL